MTVTTFEYLEISEASKLIDLALAEDLSKPGDLTSLALIDERSQGQVEVVARQPGVLAGTAVSEMVFERLDSNVEWVTEIHDGSRLQPGDVVARVLGSVRSLLTGERTALNFLTHLSGVASLTRKFVDAVSGTNATILDTRKTLPGWRILQKYAVRCGGGTNHRMGLFDGILIKDNHLADWFENSKQNSIAAAIRQSRKSTDNIVPVEVEVDTLAQLRDALNGESDVVLLDNMDIGELQQAVQMRDEESPGVQLEASGSIQLENVNEIARSGVDRISIGALTHSAVALDLAFDWKQTREAR